MIKVNTFKDLIVWQRSRELVKEVYKLLYLFPKEERFGIVDQLRRASISVVANIAEGKSRQTKKEFIQFLYIALGSSNEIEAITILAIDLKFVREEEAQKVMSLNDEVQRMLNVMIKKLKEAKS